MGKIAGIKDKSLETYPDKSGQPTISTQAVVNNTPVQLLKTPPTSLLPDGPIEAGGSGESIIVMFSGVFQWPASGSGEGSVARIRDNYGRHLSGWNSGVLNYGICAGIEYLPNDSACAYTVQPVLEGAGKRRSRY